MTHIQIKIRSVQNRKSISPRKKITFGRVLATTAIALAFSAQAYADPGCTSSAATNYDPSAYPDDGSCTFNPLSIWFSDLTLQTGSATTMHVSGGDLSYTVTDTSGITVGSIDSSGVASVTATLPLICKDGGGSVTVTDGHGNSTTAYLTITANYDSCSQCTDPSALNYNPHAGMDDGSCSYPITLSLNNYWISSLSQTTIYSNVNVHNLTFSPTSGSVSIDEYGNAVYTAPEYTGCNNRTVTVNVVDGFGTTGSIEFYLTHAGSDCSGCTDSTASNFNSSATISDNSCTYTNPTPTPVPPYSGPAIGAYVDPQVAGKYTVFGSCGCPSCWEHLSWKSADGVGEQTDIDLRCKGGVWALHDFELGQGQPGFTFVAHTDAPLGADHQYTLSDTSTLQQASTYGTYTTPICAGPYTWSPTLVSVTSESAKCRNTEKCPNGDTMLLAELVDPVACGASPTPTPTPTPIPVPPIAAFANTGSSAYYTLFGSCAAGASTVHLSWKPVNGTFTQSIDLPCADGYWVYKDAYFASGGTSTGVIYTAAQGSNTVTYILDDSSDLTTSAACRNGCQRCATPYTSKYVSTDAVGGVTACRNVSYCADNSVYFYNPATTASYCGTQTPAPFASPTPPPASSGLVPSGVFSIHNILAAIRNVIDSMKDMMASLSDSIQNMFSSGDHGASEIQSGFKGLSAPSLALQNGVQALNSILQSGSVTIDPATQSQIDALNADLQAATSQAATLTSAFQGQIAALGISQSTATLPTLNQPSSAGSTTFAPVAPSLGTLTTIQTPGHGTPSASPTPAPTPGPNTSTVMSAAQLIYGTPPIAKTCSSASVCFCPAGFVQDTSSAGCVQAISLSSLALPGLGEPRFKIRDTVGLTREQLLSWALAVSPLGQQLTFKAGTSPYHVEIMQVPAGIQVIRSSTGTPLDVTNGTMNSPESVVLQSGESVSYTVVPNYTERYGYNVMSWLALRLTDGSGVSRNLVVPFIRSNIVQIPLPYSSLSDANSSSTLIPTFGTWYLNLGNLPSGTMNRLVQVEMDWTTSAQIPLASVQLDQSWITAPYSPRDLALLKWPTPNAGDPSDWLQTGYEFVNLHDGGDWETAASNKVAIPLSFTTTINNKQSGSNLAITDLEVRPAGQGAQAAPIAYGLLAASYNVSDIAASSLTPGEDTENTDTSYGATSCASSASSASAVDTSALGENLLTQIPNWNNPPDCSCYPGTLPELSQNGWNCSCGNYQDFSSAQNHCVTKIYSCSAIPNSELWFIPKWLQDQQESIQNNGGGDAWKQALAEYGKNTKVNQSAYTDPAEIGLRGFPEAVQDCECPEGTQFDDATHSCQNSPPGDPPSGCLDGTVRNKDTGACQCPDPVHQMFIAKGANVNGWNLGKCVDVPPGTELRNYNAAGGDHPPVCPNLPAPPSDDVLAKSQILQCQDGKAWRGMFPYLDHGYWIHNTTPNLNVACTIGVVQDLGCDTCAPGSHDTGKGQCECDDDPNNGIDGAGKKLPFPNPVNSLFPPNIQANGCFQACSGSAHGHSRGSKGYGCECTGDQYYDFKAPTPQNPSTGSCKDMCGGGGRVEDLQKDEYGDPKSWKCTCDNGYFDGNTCVSCMGNSTWDGNQCVCNDSTMQYFDGVGCAIEGTISTHSCVNKPCTPPPPVPVNTVLPKCGSDGLTGGNLTAFMNIPAGNPAGARAACCPDGYILNPDDSSQCLKLQGTGQVADPNQPPLSSIFPTGCDADDQQVNSNGTCCPASTKFNPVSGMCDPDPEKCDASGNKQTCTDTPVMPSSPHTFAKSLGDSAQASIPDSIPDFSFAPAVLPLPLPVPQQLRTVPKALQPLANKVMMTGVSAAMANASMVNEAATFLGMTTVQGNPQMTGATQKDNNATGTGTMPKAPVNPDAPLTGQIYKKQDAGSGKSSWAANGQLSLSNLKITKDASGQTHITTKDGTSIQTVTMDENGNAFKSDGTPLGEVSEMAVINDSAGNEIFAVKIGDDWYMLDPASNKTPWDLTTRIQGSSAPGSDSNHPNADGGVNTTKLTYTPGSTSGALGPDTGTTGTGTGTTQPTLAHPEVLQSRFNEAIAYAQRNPGMNSMAHWTVDSPLPLDLGFTVLAFEADANGTVYAYGMSGDGVYHPLGPVDQDPNSDSYKHIFHIYTEMQTSGGTEDPTASTDASTGSSTETPVGFSGTTNTGQSVTMSGLGIKNGQVVGPNGEAIQYGSTDGVTQIATLTVTGASNDVPSSIQVTVGFKADGTTVFLDPLSTDLSGFGKTNTGSSSTPVSVTVTSGSNGSITTSNSGTITSNGSTPVTFSGSTNTGQQVIVKGLGVKNGQVVGPDGQALQYGSVDDVTQVGFILIDEAPTGVSLTTSILVGFKGDGTMVLLNPSTSDLFGFTTTRENSDVAPVTVTIGTSPSGGTTTSGRIPAGTPDDGNTAIIPVTFTGTTNTAQAVTIEGLGVKNGQVVGPNGAAIQYGSSTEVTEVGTISVDGAPDGAGEATILVGFKPDGSAVLLNPATTDLSTFTSNNGKAGAGEITVTVGADSNGNLTYSSTATADVNVNGVTPVVFSGSTNKRLVVTVNGLGVKNGQVVSQDGQAIQYSTLDDVTHLGHLVVVGSPKNVDESITIVVGFKSDGSVVFLDPVNTDFSGYPQVDGDLNPAPVTLDAVTAGNGTITLTPEGDSRVIAPNTPEFPNLTGNTHNMSQLLQAHSALRAEKAAVNKAADDYNKKSMTSGLITLGAGANDGTAGFYFSRNNALTNFWNYGAWRDWTGSLGFNIEILRIETDEDRLNAARVVFNNAYNQFLTDFTLAAQQDGWEDWQINVELYELETWMLKTIRIAQAQAFNSISNTKESEALGEIAAVNAAAVVASSTIGATGVPELVAASAGLDVASLQYLQVLINNSRDAAKGANLNGPSTTNRPLNKDLDAARKDIWIEAGKAAVITEIILRGSQSLEIAAQYGSNRFFASQLARSALVRNAMEKTGFWKYATGFGIQETTAAAAIGYIELSINLDALGNILEGLQKIQDGNFHDGWAQIENALLSLGITSRVTHQMKDALTAEADKQFKEQTDPVNPLPQKAGDAANAIREVQTRISALQNQVVQAQKSAADARTTANAMMARGEVINAAVWMAEASAWETLYQRTLPTEIDKLTRDLNTLENLLTTLNGGTPNGGSGTTPNTPYSYPAQPSESSLVKTALEAWRSGTQAALASRAGKSYNILSQYSARLESGSTDFSDLPALPDGVVPPGRYLPGKVPSGQPASTALSPAELSALFKDSMNYFGELQAALTVGTSLSDTRSGTGLLNQLQRKIIGDFVATTPANQATALSSMDVETAIKAYSQLTDAQKRALMEYVSTNTVNGFQRPASVPGVVTVPNTISTAFDYVNWLYSLSDSAVNTVIDSSPTSRSTDGRTASDLHLPSSQTLLSSDNMTPSKFESIVSQATKLPPGKVIQQLPADQAAFITAAEASGSSTVSLSTDSGGNKIITITKPRLDSSGNAIPGQTDTLYIGITQNGNVVTVPAYNASLRNYSEAFLTILQSALAHPDKAFYRTLMQIVSAKATVLRDEALQSQNLPYATLAEFHFYQDMLRTLGDAETVALANKQVEYLKNYNAGQFTNPKPAALTGSSAIQTRLSQIVSRIKNADGTPLSAADAQAFNDKVQSWASGGTLSPEVVSVLAFLDSPIGRQYKIVYAKSASVHSIGEFTITIDSEAIDAPSQPGGKYFDPVATLIHEGQHALDKYMQHPWTTMKPMLSENFPNPIVTLRELRSNLAASNGDATKAWQLTKDFYPSTSALDTGLGSVFPEWNSMSPALKIQTLERLVQWMQGAGAAKLNFELYVAAAGLGKTDLNKYVSPDFDPQAVFNQAKAAAEQDLANGASGWTPPVNLTPPSLNTDTPDVIENGSKSGSGSNQTYTLPVSTKAALDAGYTPLQMASTYALIAAENGGIKITPNTRPGYYTAAFKKPTNAGPNGISPISTDYVLFHVDTDDRVVSIDYVMGRPKASPNDPPTFTGATLLDFVARQYPGYAFEADIFIDTNERRTIEFFETIAKNPDILKNPRALNEAALKIPFLRARPGITTLEVTFSDGVPTFGALVEPNTQPDGTQKFVLKNLQEILAKPAMQQYLNSLKNAAKRRQSSLESGIDSMGFTDDTPEQTNNDFGDNLIDGIGDESLDGNESSDASDEPASWLQGESSTLSTSDDLLSPEDLYARMLYNFSRSSSMLAYPPNPMPGDGPTAAAHITLYFCDWGDRHWSNEANWFIDASCTQAAHRVPANGDFVVIQEIPDGAYVDTVPPITLTGYVGAAPSDGNGHQTAGITIAAGGTLTVTDGQWGGTTADSSVTTTFSGSAVNFGTVNGSATFNGSSDNSGSVTGSVNWGSGNPHDPSQVTLAVASPIYFCDQGNHAWNDSGNWFASANCVNRANRIPGTNDSVTIQSAPSSFSDTPSAVTLSSFTGSLPWGDTNGQQTSGLTIASGGALNCTNGNWGGTTADNTVSVSFSNCFNFGYIIGDATFNSTDPGYIFVNAGTVMGTATFNGYGNMSGTIGGCAGNCGGCTDITANNYNAFAIQNQGCTYMIYGCTDPGAVNYNSSANQNDGSCSYNMVYGCTNSSATNYNPSANQDDGSCSYYQTVNGCMNPSASNYNPSANQDDGSCTFVTPGCTNSSALNYNPSANQDDGSCQVPAASNSTLYYCSTGSSSNWSDATSWYMESGCSTPAYRAPANGDSVVIQSGVFTDTPSTIGLASYSGAAPSNSGQTSNININGSGALTVITGEWGGTTSDSSVSVTFNGATNRGTINGSAAFNTLDSTGASNAGTVNGDASFYGIGTSNTGTVSGTATFTMGATAGGTYSACSGDGC